MPASRPLAALLLTALAALPLAGFASDTTDPARADRMEQARARFQAADANGDGQISRAEAEAKMPRLAQRFDDVDANGDGQLSIEEMRKLAQMRRERGR